jgi:glycosyltransferase involved in cell wall biosynthesis
MSNEESGPGGNDPEGDQTRALCSAYLALQAQAQANRALRREIDALKASHSWRVTAPLRRLRAWLGTSDRSPTALPPAPAVTSGALPDASSLLLDRVRPDRADVRVARRQLLVDVSELAREDLGAGVQRVVWRILRELLLEPPAGFRVEPVRLAGDDAGYVHARGFLGRMLGLDEGEAGNDQPVTIAPGDRFLGLDLIRDHAGLAGPALRSMRAQGASITFVVYDLLPLQHPEWFPDGMDERFRQWVRLLADCADQALCISDTVCGDLRAALAREAPRAELRMASFPLGSDLDAWPRPGAGLRPPPAGTARFLMVGTVEPRKGHVQVLDAFERLWAQGQACELLIVGHVGWSVASLVERLRGHAEAGRRLHWIEACDDADLLAAYRGSTALLAASFGEGFGLPLVEAAAQGLPVLARDLAVFREVAGVGADYFTGAEAEALAAAITQWLSRWRAGSTADPSAIGRHSWRESADALKRILDGA